VAVLLAGEAKLVAALAPHCPWPRKAELQGVLTAGRRAPLNLAVAPHKGLGNKVVVALEKLILVAALKNFTKVQGSGGMSDERRWQGLNGRGAQVGLAYVTVYSSTLT
jgi:hypothetical protein